MEKTFKITTEQICFNSTMSMKGALGLELCINT